MNEDERENKKMDEETREEILALKRHIDDLWKHLRAYEAAMDVLVGRLLAKVPPAELEAWFTGDTDFRVLSMQSEPVTDAGERAYRAVFTRLPERVRRNRERSQG